MCERLWRDVLEQVGFVRKFTNTVAGSRRSRASCTESPASSRPAWRRSQHHRFGDDTPLKKITPSRHHPIDYNEEVELVVGVGALGPKNAFLSVRDLVQEEGLRDVGSRRRKGPSSSTPSLLGRTNPCNSGTQSRIRSLNELLSRLGAVASPISRSKLRKSSKIMNLGKKNGGSKSNDPYKK